MALRVPLKMEYKREISGLPPVPSINAGDVWEAPEDYRMDN